MFPPVKFPSFQRGDSFQRGLMVAYARRGKYHDITCFHVDPCTYAFAVFVNNINSVAFDFKFVYRKPAIHSAYHSPAPPLTIDS